MEAGRWLSGLKCLLCKSGDLTLEPQNPPKRDTILQVFVTSVHLQEAGGYTVKQESVENMAERQGLILYIVL